MGINVLDDKIVKLFNDSPTWFRNAIYALVVVVACAYFLIPTEIGGVVDETDVAGERRSASNLMVSAVRGSVRYYVNATNDGTWRMLSPSRFPGTYEIDFRSSMTPLQVIGTITTCYRDFLPGATIRVHYAPQASGYPIVRVDDNCAAEAMDRVAAESARMRLSLISAAKAQATVHNQPLDLRQIDRGLDSVSNQSEQTLQRREDLRTLGIERQDVAQALASEKPRDYLERTAVLKSIANAASVYLYAGSVDNRGNWIEQKLTRVQNMSGSLQHGDVVSADVPINLRADYIRKTWVGWRLADKLGQARAGDTFVVRNSKLIGNHVWVEAVPVEVDR